MAETTFAQFGADVAKLDRAFEKTALTKYVTKAATLAQQDVDGVVSGDFGADRGFTGGKGRGSGWRTKAGQVIPMVTTVHPLADGVVELVPKGRNAGLFTVANAGRHPMVGPHFTAKVTRQGNLSKKRRLSKTNARRFSGETSGKGTVTRAVSLVAKNTPQRMQSQVVAVIATTLGG